MIDASAGRSPFAGQQRLTPQQKTLIVLVGLGSMLEFWDAYLIGFIMAFLIKPWGLTFGIMGAVLLASGAGAVVGGWAWGALADRFGRKPVFVGSLLLLALASLGLAFTPEGAWMYMVVLRVIIGFCTGGFFIQVALVQEFIPPKRRGALTGVVSAITTGGLLLGAFSGAFVIPAIGWRWTFALGAAPALIALFASRYVPESPRWLLLHGREAEARRSVEWALGRPLDDFRFDTGRSTAPTPWHAIFRLPRHVLTAFFINIGLISGYYGIVMWAPTLLAQVQSLSAAEASKVMIGFSLLGVVARLVSASLADRIGRRKVGAFLAFGAAVMTLIAGYVGHGSSGSQGLFWLPLLAAFVLADGSFAICALYSTEIWPSRLRGSGSGFAGLCGSLGKMLGPLGLALVAGSSNRVMPAATVGVIVPAFTFLAVCLVVCGITYLLGIEARGVALEAIDQGAEEGAPALAPGATSTAG
jgi:putative MFS transporter